MTLRFDKVVIRDGGAIRVGAALQCSLMRGRVYCYERIHVHKWHVVHSHSAIQSHSVIWRSIRRRRSRCCEAEGQTRGTRCRVHWNCLYRGLKVGLYVAIEFLE